MLPDRYGLPSGMSSEAARDICVPGCDGVLSAVRAGRRFERAVLTQSRSRP